MIVNGCSKCAFSEKNVDEFPCTDCHYNGGTHDYETPKGYGRCMKCGAIIPEERHICLTCEGENEMQTFKTREEHPADPFEEWDKPLDLPPVEKVNHPAHYQGKHECIDEMISLFGVEAVKGFCRCNVYKYRYRADRKNGSEDIAKADWYMDKLMELEGADNGNG